MLVMFDCHPGCHQRDNQFLLYECYEINCDLETKKKEYDCLGLAAFLLFILLFFLFEIFVKSFLGIKIK